MRKLIYCKDCKYFKDAWKHSDNSPWYNCYHSVMRRGNRKGKHRIVLATFKGCSDFVLKEGEENE